VEIQQLLAVRYRVTRIATLDLSQVGRVSDSVTRHSQQLQRIRYNPRFCRVTAIA
jgi:hypothetical protein